MFTVIRNLALTSGQAISITTTAVREPHVEVIIQEAVAAIMEVPPEHSATVPAPDQAVTAAPVQLPVHLPAAVPEVVQADQLLFVLSQEEAINLYIRSGTG